MVEEYDLQTNELQGVIRGLMTWHSQYFREELNYYPTKTQAYGR